MPEPRLEPCPVCGGALELFKSQNGRIGRYFCSPCELGMGPAAFASLASAARLWRAMSQVEQECDQIILRRWVGGWTAAGYMAGKVAGGGKGATIEAAMTALSVEARAGEPGE